MPEAVCGRNIAKASEHPDLQFDSRLRLEGKECVDDSASSDDSPCPDALRRTQSLAGELLWLGRLGVRARPELGFAIARMAQLCTRRPEDSLILISWPGHLFTERAQGKR